MRTGATPAIKSHRAPPCLSSSSIAAALPLSSLSPARHSIIKRPLSSLRAASEDPPSSAATTADTATTAAVTAERLRGVRTVLAELKGLDMPPNEVLRYAQGAVRLPKRAPPAADGVPVSRASEALAQIMAASYPQSQGGKAAAGIAATEAAAVAGGAAAVETMACDDPAALAALNHLLTDLWRWKRRGGGSRWDEDDEATSPSAVALIELQGVDSDGRQAAMAKAAADKAEGKGGFFDAGNLDEREKQELAGMMRGAAMAGVQNAFWGSLVMSAAVLLLLNFARNG